MNRAPWPKEDRPGRFVVRYRTPGPVLIAKTLIWLMRDRGLSSPDDLHGVTRAELEASARLRKKGSLSTFETFDEALDDAIASGWVASYEAAGETYYFPDYRRAP